MLSDITNFLIISITNFAAWYDIGEVDDSDEVFCSPHDPGDDPGGRIEISSQASSGVTEQLICGELSTMSENRNDAKPLTGPWLLCCLEGHHSIQYNLK